MLGRGFSQWTGLHPAQQEARPLLALCCVTALVGNRLRALMSQKWDCPLRSAWNLPGEPRDTKNKSFLPLCDLHFRHPASRSERPQVPRSARGGFGASQPARKQCPSAHGARVWVRFQTSAVSQILVVTWGKLLEPCKSHPLHP